jgi:hypothetical protein
VLNHVASLQLPSVQQGIELALFSTHSGPFTTLPSKKYQNGLMREDKPFTSAPESRVHAMCVQYHLGGAGLLERRSRFFFFIKNEYLMRFVESYQEVHGPGQDSDAKEMNEFRIVEKVSARKVPWEVWGPDHSRFMAYGMHFRWLRSVTSFTVFIGDSFMFLQICPWSESRLSTVCYFSGQGLRIGGPGLQRSCERAARSDWCWRRW